MMKVLGSGIADFKKIIDTNTFYVDKTRFIEEWCSNTDEITLITRPRRFGKTLTMSMLEYFFSDKYKEQTYLFEELYIWKCGQKYRNMQGNSPVINISFINVRYNTYKDTYDAFKGLISNIYSDYRYLLDSDVMDSEQKKVYKKVIAKKENKSEFASSLERLSYYLEKHTGKKVYIFIDEYDAPLQEAYVSGFWDKITQIMLLFFLETFKNNKSLNRAILTGVTRVAKESIFSGLNNLEVITTTSCSYANCFGFTEKETFDALEMYGLSNKKEQVKSYYDGFIMGDGVEIYNPWSVINFLKKKKFSNYWMNTSGNNLIDVSIKHAETDIKSKMTELLKGNTVDVEIKEEIIFRELSEEPNAIWSLMLAAGYLKVSKVDNDIYTVAITNMETKNALESLVKGWFKKEKITYNEFILSMLNGDSESMEDMLNILSLSMFSSFDVGVKPSELRPERFYHGFVLGLLVDLKEDYIVDSNRESGYGRYDIMIKPKDKKKDVGVIIEFKVFSPKKEKDMEQTVQNALKQIDEKLYEEKLTKEGVQTIYKYGIAFCGKECKIGML